MKSTTLNQKIKQRAEEIWYEKQLEGVEWCFQRAIAEANKEYRKDIIKTWDVDQQVNLRAIEIWYEKHLESSEWCIQRAKARAIAEWNQLRGQ
jgi:hypothetical protein